MDYSNQLLYHPILALTKVSILLLYHRLSVSRTFRLWINVLIGLNIALTVSIFVSDLLQCIPMAFLWDKTIPGGKCMNQQAFFIGSAVMNIFSDCAVLVLPIPMVWGMQTNTRKKVALIFLFSLGILYGSLFPSPFSLSPPLYIHLSISPPLTSVPQRLCRECHTSQGRSKPHRYQHQRPNMYLSLPLPPPLHILTPPQSQPGSCGPGSNAASP